MFHSCFASCIPPDNVNQTLVHNSSHFLFQFYSLWSTIVFTANKQWSKILFKNLRVTQSRSCPTSAEPRILNTVFAGYNCDSFQTYTSCFFNIHFNIILPLTRILNGHFQSGFLTNIHKAGAISSDFRTSCSVLQFRMRYSNSMAAERAGMLAETFVVCLKEVSAWLVAVWHSKLLNLPFGSFTAWTGFVGMSQKYVAMHYAVMK